MIRYLLSAAAVLIFISGCAPKDPLPPGNHFESSHIAVPFVSPRSKLCASTALEMASKYWQASSSYRPYLTRNELDQRTLIPAKEGTLQIELVSTARADGFLVYPLEPSLDALMAELKAGHPVIVLVNRGYSWYPFWHYVMVTGYEASNQTITAHFAETPDEAIPVSTFSALWERSGFWGIVPVPPAIVPATGNAKKWLRSAYDLETTGMLKEALTAYENGVKKWPENTEIWFALANIQYRNGSILAAEKSYRKLLSLDPEHLLARNNLADLLCGTGKKEDALKVLDVDLVSADAKTRLLLEATKSEIQVGCPTVPTHK